MEETILGNRYQIIRKIGDGGMAFVYQAKDKLLNRIVAVKVLRPEFADDEEFLAKFKREAEAVAKVAPEIVQKGAESAQAPSSKHSARRGSNRRGHGKARGTKGSAKENGELK